MHKKWISLIAVSKTSKLSSNDLKHIKIAEVVSTIAPELNTKSAVVFHVLRDFDCQFDWININNYFSINSTGLLVLFGNHKFVLLWVERNFETRQCQYILDLTKKEIRCNNWEKFCVIASYAIILVNFAFILLNFFDMFSFFIFIIVTIVFTLRSSHVKHISLFYVNLSAKSYYIAYPNSFNLILSINDWLS